MNSDLSSNRMNIGAGSWLLRSSGTLTTSLAFAAPAHSDDQAEAAVLVDYVQGLEPAAVGRGIELEISGPNLWGCSAR